jgi:hypothetical protein
MSNPDPDRRDFVRTAGALALGAVAAPEALAAQPNTQREYYELRAYHLRRGPRERLMSDYVKDALVPALRRHGTGPVGVFNVAIGPDSPTLYVLIPHPTLASVGTVADALARDEEYQRAGAPVLGAPATEAPYDRIESSLMVSFAGMPKLAVPAQVAAGKGRLFELRRYESHSESANARKVNVFDTAEIAIFERHGMRGVFYGRTLVGPRMPNLTYMLVFDDMRDRDARWAEGVADPEFRALLAKPENADAAIVSSISSMFLRPGAGSQL